MSTNYCWIFYIKKFRKSDNKKFNSPQIHTHWPQICTHLLQIGGLDIFHILFKCAELENGKKWLVSATIFKGQK